MTRSLLAALALFPTFAFAEPEWIWSSKSAKPDEKVTLSTEFDVPGPVKKATLRFSVDNSGRATLNGQPAGVVRDWKQPAKEDVTKVLKAGKNSLQVLAQNEDGVAAAVVELRIELADGTKLAIESNAQWKAGPGQAVTIAKYGDQPWGKVLDSKATPEAGTVVAADQLQLPPGFKAELLYTVPKADQGSWVALTVDPKGRLIAGDQYGGLYRLDVSVSPVKVEPLAPVHGPDGKPVSGAHGLLCAFDSLYAVVCEGPTKGLWRLRDTNGDDQYDQAELLHKMDGSGEHGPHSVVLGPDKKSLWLCAGNHTKPIANLAHSRALAWQEDHLTARLWDGNGHARGILAPGGVVYRCDPDGKNLEAVTVGFRNQFDIAFDAQGELFTFDSDMEWDIGAPWYRPTRIAHCTSGGENGWRSGAGKWPDNYPDNLPPVLGVGPASPTGTVFGTGAKFPAKYQRALYALDWTYGTMWAIHLTPAGASFRAEKEEFVAGKPLPLTDAIIHPRDGAMYFAIGGRRTQSGLYRVTYAGTESTAPATPYTVTAEAKLRHDLEKLHAKGTGAAAIDQAWPHLAHQDRFVRFAARVAIEHQPVEKWAARALAEKNPQAALEALIALARLGRSADAQAAALEAQKKPGVSSGPVFATLPADTALQKQILDALGRFDLATLPPELRFGFLRAYQLAFTRLGRPAPELRAAVAARLDPLFPGKDALENRELVQLLVFVDSPTIVGKTVPLLATTQDAGETLASDAVLARNEGYAKAAQAMTASRPNRQAIAYAYHLRAATAGWTPALRKTYFAWFPLARQWKGGNSFPKFMENIRVESLANVPEAERAALDQISKQTAPTAPKITITPKGPGKGYTIDDVVKLVGPGLRGRNFENGKAMYAATLCASCHKFAGDGGNIGPDLTGSGNRYTIRDLAENLIDPSKVISDQYDSHELTLKDGSVVIGRVIVEENDKLFVMTSPLTPDDLTAVNAADVKGRKTWPISMMPPGLINSLNEDELKDLIAYLQSGGNPNDKAFAP